jgi:sugar/nucleoside kinase (ribokinase family)
MEGAYDVITIGTAVRDVFASLNSDKVCFDPGAKVDIPALTERMGGGAVNAAVTFARQGFKTMAVCAIGADRTGADIEEYLKEESIAPQCVVKKNTASGESVILLFKNGERTALAHRGASDALDISDIQWPELKPRFAYIAPGHIRPHVISAVIKHCYYQGVHIAFNPSADYCHNKGALLKPLLPMVRMVFMNAKEAAAATGALPTDPADAAARLDGLLDGVVVVTDGPRGARVVYNGKEWRAGIFDAISVRDRTGAGDAFASGFVAGFMKKEDISYALRLASANAAAVVAEIGAHDGALTARAFEAGRAWKNLAIYE